VEDPPAGELIHPSTSSPRARLRQFRQEHLYSGTPGRTVWAQSRQTNRPSLCAIIGLNSIPTMQWGHLMVKVVSVSVGIGSLLHTSKKCRTRGSRHRASSYRWKPEDTARTRAAISAGLPTGRQAVGLPSPLLWRCQRKRPRFFRVTVMHCRTILPRKLLSTTLRSGPRYGKWPHSLSPSGPRTAGHAYACASSTIWNRVRIKYKTEGLSNLNHTSRQFESIA
jgi:hypothetical protein